MYGLYDAVGKSGWYALQNEFGGEYDEKIGSGRSSRSLHYLHLHEKFQRAKKICLSIT